MAEYKRFFVDDIGETTVEIIGEEFTHAVSVLRIKVGDKITVCNGKGKEYICNVSNITKKALYAEIEKDYVADKDAKERVMLICGLLKGDKTELVVQKAVELGVREIVIFSSKFCSAYINENKLARLNKVGVEACKQCGRAVLPKITYKENLHDALLEAKDYQNKLFACEFAKSGVDISSLTGSTAIVVGSEGGFSNDEYNSALEMGYKTVYLGKRILRAETASIALLGIIAYALGELK